MIDGGRPFFGRYGMIYGYPRGIICRSYVINNIAFDKIVKSL